MDAWVCPALAEYVRAVHQAVEARLSVPETVQQVVADNHRFLEAGRLLPEPLRTYRPDVPYTRNLIHQDPDGRFAVIAIVWGPFQETSVGV